MDEYLSKPVNTAGLRRAMAAVLPADTLKRASQPIEPLIPDRGTVIEALHGMDADGVDVQLVLKLFREESTAAIAQLEKALVDGDSDDLWRAAHKLKGMAAEVGAESLRERWDKLERCARSGDLDKSEKLFRKAKAELQQVNKILDDARIGGLPPLAS
jgi:HPt (histidine-containing phosphotransfer) domain-containing protein